MSFEVTLNYDVMKGRELNWNTGITFSTYHVTLTKLDESLKGSYVGAYQPGNTRAGTTQLTRAVEGQPIVFYGGIILRNDAAGQYCLLTLPARSNTDKNPVQQVIEMDYPILNLDGLILSSIIILILFLPAGSIGHQLINTFRAFYENPNVAQLNIVNTNS